MYYELLNAGDRVLTITTNFLSIERNDGSVELYPIYMRDGRVCLNTDSITTIGYTSNEESGDTDEYITENNVHIINF